MTTLAHTLGKGTLTPHELRRQIRLEIIEGRIVRRDITHWVPAFANRNDKELSEFIDTGRAASEQFLIRLETAWLAYKAGRLKPKSVEIAALRKTSPGFKNAYHHQPRTSPLYDFEKERKLATKRMLAMSREETDLLGISQSTVQKARHGWIPQWDADKVERIFNSKRLGRKPYGRERTEPPVGNPESDPKQAGREQGQPRPAQ